MNFLLMQFLLKIPKSGAMISSCLALLLLAPTGSFSQQGYSLDPLGTAVPISERPPELREAQDLLTKDGTGLRLRAEVWVRFEPCPNKKPRDNCNTATQSQGRLFVGPVWNDHPIGNLEVEQVWLLHKGGVWSTRSLRKTADHYIEFSGGPVLPTSAPVDVLVKIRDLPGLLQVRYRTVYPRAAAA